MRVAQATGAKDAAGDISEARRLHTIAKKGDLHVEPEVVSVTLDAGQHFHDTTRHGDRCNGECF
jgi:hypothetical protein